MPRVIGYLWTYCLFCKGYRNFTTYASWLGEHSICNACGHLVREQMPWIASPWMENQ